MSEQELPSHLLDRDHFSWEPLGVGNRLLSVAANQKVYELSISLAAIYLTRSKHYRRFSRVLFSLQDRSQKRWGS